MEGNDMFRAGHNGRRNLIAAGRFADPRERWLGESEQSDKWNPCLIAAPMPRSRREDVETITAQPQPWVQGEGRLGCDQR
jgi:hypothetical protein